MGLFCSPSLDLLFLWKVCWTRLNCSVFWCFVRNYLYICSVFFLVGKWTTKNLKIGHLPLGLRLRPERLRLCSLISSRDTRPVVYDGRQASDMSPFSKIDRIAWHWGIWFPVKAFRSMIERDSFTRILQHWSTQTMQCLPRFNHIDFRCFNVRKKKKKKNIKSKESYISSVVVVMGTDSTYQYVENELES